MNDDVLAVLIDADNISYTAVNEMLEEITKYGTPGIKRIYGDWTRPNLSGWKNVLLENAITPIQQYSYTSGKNSSDSALIIDAMDILYSGKASGFCIVSSDSDFTRLAIRLREAGKLVIGIGERKTPRAFIASCDKFIYLEILKKPEVSTNGQAKADQKEAAKEPIENNKELIKFMTESVLALADDTGWAFLGSLGNFILKKKPDFDPRNYGFQKLLPLIRQTGLFELDERAGSNNVRLIYVRVKN